MEWASVDAAFHQALKSLGRFPLVLLCGFIGAGAALWLNHLPVANESARAIAGNLMLSAWVGVGFLFCLALFAESRKLPALTAWALQVVGISALCAYYYFQPRFPYPIRVTRFWLFLLAVNLAVGLAPALGREMSLDAFWHFNQRLAARLGLSLAHSSAIFLGLELALASIKSLFEIKIPDNLFLDPAILVLGAFNTWFFLAGIPDLDPGELESRPYPRQLRVTSLAVLLPLVSIYLLILYAYAAKVLAAWKWPTGWVTYLILGFCSLGTFSQLLLQPLADRENNRWAKAFCDHFHKALAPLLILLMAAIGRRIHEYGLTENRYFVLAVTVWLLGIVVHSALDKRRDLRILPASLCLIVLLASFGPWGAFEVSRKSQEQRLQGLLETQGMLAGGKLAKASGRVPRRVNEEISAIAQYLEARNRLVDLKPWLPDMDDSGQTHSVAWHKALDNKFAFLEALELPYLPPARRGPDQAEAIAFFCRACATPVQNVSGYDFIYLGYQPDTAAGIDQPGLIGDGFRFSYDADAGLLRFFSKDSAGPALDIEELFQGLRERYPDAYDLNLPEEEMVLEGEDKAMKVRVRLKSMQGEAGEDASHLKGFAADLYVKAKPKTKWRPPRS